MANSRSQLDRESIAKLDQKVGQNLYSNNAYVLLAIARVEEGMTTTELREETGFL